MTIIVKLYNNCDLNIFQGCQAEECTLWKMLIIFRSNESIVYQTMDANWLKPDPDLETTTVESTSTTIPSTSLIDWNLILIWRQPQLSQHQLIQYIFYQFNWLKPDLDSETTTVESTSTTISSTSWNQILIWRHQQLSQHQLPFLLPF